MSYYQLNIQQRNEIKEYIDNFNMSSLLNKSAYKGDKQEFDYIGTYVTIKIVATRLYPFMNIHRTNIVGDIIIIINDELQYTLTNLKYLISWKSDICSLRMVVPSNLLSEDLLKFFTKKIIEQGNITESTETEQIVYFNEMDGGEVLLTTYPQIIIEQKGE